VEKRTMERHAGIIGQRGPFAVEADEQGDVCPNSFASLAGACRTGVIRFLEGKGPGRQP
jgi:hypothetical protein